MMRAVATAGQRHRRSATTPGHLVAHTSGGAARPAGALAAGPKKEPTELERRGSPVSTLCPLRGSSSDDSAPVSDAEAEGRLHSLGGRLGTLFWAPCATLLDMLQGLCCLLELLGLQTRWCDGGHVCSQQ